MQELSNLFCNFHKKNELYHDTALLDAPTLVSKIIYYLPQIGIFMKSSLKLILIRPAGTFGQSRNVLPTRKFAISLAAVL